MANRRVERLSEASRDYDSSESLGVQIERGLEQIKEDIRREIEEMQHLQERESNWRLQEAMRQMEAKMQQNDEAIRVLREGMQRMEENLEVLGRRSLCENAGGQEAVEQLEGRMVRLEATLQKTLDSAFPRVEALLVQLEERAPPKAPSTPSSPPSSITACSFPSRQAAPGPSCSVPPVDPERRKALGKGLRDAASKGKLKEVRRLLNAGADVDYPGPLNMTPLMDACVNEHADVVSLLLQRGADVHARVQSESTALHLAAYFDGSELCVPLLLGAGAHVDARDVEGRTPLHDAAKQSNMEAVRALLAAGASKTARDSSGRRPYDDADASAVRRLLSP